MDRLRVVGGTIQRDCGAGTEVETCRRNRHVPAGLPHRDDAPGAILAVRCFVEGPDQVEGSRHTALRQHGIMLTGRIILCVAFGNHEILSFDRCTSLRTRLS